MLLISRSAYEARRACRLRFYYQYLYAKTGFQEARTPFHLAFGIALHAGMETLVRGAQMEADGSALLDPATAIDAAHGAWTAERPSGSFPPKEPPQEEVLALLEALILGWVRIEAPRFFSEYEVVSVEREGQPQPLSPSAALQFRADVVVRSRSTGQLRVINWKSTSGWTDWTDQWSTEIQSFTEAWALEQEAGEAVEGTVMAGFHKGALRQTQGQAHFASPLIWAYKRTFPDGRVEYNADTKAPSAVKDGSPKWEKFKVWEEEFDALDVDGQPTTALGVSHWVSWLPLHVVAASFLTSEVLHGHPKTIAAFIESAGREARDDHHVLTEGTDADKLAHFGPTFGKWTCGTKQEPKCAFFRVCHTDATMEDLIEEGVLKPREDHHAPAVE